MKIINPLYDKAFKFLMQNKRLAKKVLSVILDQEILELSLGQQETVIPDDKRVLTLFRLDFKAIIVTPENTKQTVLIELQKSKFPTDIQRFRTYLGMNYIDSETKTIADKEVKTSYPIITIYILGYELKDLPYMAVTVNRCVTNAVTKKEIKVNSFFVEHLTHRSHILQVKHLPEKRRTRLEKLLVIFNQAWCTNERFILDLQEVPEEFEDIVKYLQSPVMDDNFLRQLRGEEEIDQIFDEQELKYIKQIEEAKKREEKAKQREEKAKQREEEAKQRERIQNIKIIKKLYKSGMSVNKISEITGKPVSEIRGIID
ncbi:MAG: hypothetical protein FVQ77_15635 [Cytophagales bacterium]|nr:hypothetical protein [Cytophagales bacterium]